MIDTKKIKIFRQFEKILTANFINDYDCLMRGNIGETVSVEIGREVRKIYVNYEGKKYNFYLKRNWQEVPLIWTVKKILRGKLQHSKTYQELQAINLLIKENFPVMKPVAWGERRVLTTPVEGFLLVEAVAGESAETYWRLNEYNVRLRLMQDIGTLLGKLNVAGFFAWVRLKDIICSDIPSDPQQSIPLTLIDRECSKDRKQKFTPGNCYQCLAECYGYLLKIDPTPTRREILVFIRSYLAETQTYGLNSKKLVSEVKCELDRLSKKPGPFRYLINRDF